MNKLSKVIFLSSLAVASSIIVGCSITNFEKNNVSSTSEDANFIPKSIEESPQSSQKINLSIEEKEGLLLMREEEKLARDVYNTLYNKWGINIFKNIAKSEQTHTDAIRNILNIYNIPDPMTNDIPGSFQSAKLQNLYDALVSQGYKSQENALLVGATVEDVDIDDLQKLLEATSNEDIRLVYEKLVAGSYNHMRAFVKNIERFGMSYTPAYISIEEYNSIILKN